MKQIQKDEKIVVVRYFVVKKNEKKKVIGAFMVFNDFDEMDACRQQLRKRHRCDQIDMDWKIIAASSVIDFNTYQEKAFSTAQYPDAGRNLIYPMLGLGEAGEVQGKAKKIQRDDKNQLTENRRDEIISELGDLLWYIAACACELRVPLGEIAQRNLDKLQGRNENDMIKGDGDKR